MDKDNYKQRREIYITICLKYSTSQYGNKEKI